MSNQITCPCGTTFEKSPGRGRPPKWCPTCREQRSAPIPRVKVTVTVEIEEGKEVREGYTPKGRKYDPYDTLTPEQRDRVEDGIEEVAERYKTEIWPNREAIWPNMSDTDRHSAFLRWHQDAMTEVYKSVNPKWYQRRGESA